jgi:AbrB family looped-hinge helix DNA binding protein
MPSAMARPAHGTATGRVWDLADELTLAKGRRALRSEVIERYTAEGGNANTASTQYHYWKSRHENGAQDKAAPGVTDIQVKEAGRIVLPANFRDALGIKEGDFLSAEIVEGEIRITPLDTAIRKAQALVRRYIPEGVSLVDELIAERRREAQRENEE